VTHTHINYKKLVGSNVRLFRLGAKVSQDLLAHRCGIFRTYLSRIETGLANPTLLVLVALATSLKVSPGELFRVQGADSSAVPVVIHPMPSDLM
jgi:transcriptional regulator with XRE-family HTH domain